jgi:hypothetical protein
MQVGCECPQFWQQQLPEHMLFDLAQQVAAG